MIKYFVILFCLIIFETAGYAYDCSDNLIEKTWDKTKIGYCKIFFPDCDGEKVGRKLSYARIYNNGEIICTSAMPGYSYYYKINMSDVNSVFGTNFEKIGINYETEMSKWLFENCTQFCDNTNIKKRAAIIEPVVKPVVIAPEQESISVPALSQYDLMRADEELLRQKSVAK